jgi:hypothetical protein
MRTPSPASVVSHHQFTKTHQPARRLSDLLYPSRLCSAMDDSAGEADGRSQVSRNRGALLSSAPQHLSRSSTALAGGIAPPGRCSPAISVVAGSRVQFVPPFVPFPCVPFHPSRTLAFSWRVDFGSLSVLTLCWAFFSSSEPPDIKNWFSSYVYDSPEVTEQVADHDSGDGSETQDPFEVIIIFRCQSHPPTY